MYVVPDESFDRIGNALEEANETSRVYLEQIADMIIPKAPEPWLVEKEALGYPEHVPTLVLDLDKVLCHLVYDRRYGWQVLKRPGADKFLEELQFYYELVVFSDDVYPVAADVLSRWADARGVRCQITAILHREFCNKKKDMFVKDISKLGRKPDRLVILDHDPNAIMLQPENGILISPYEGNPDDRELDNLLEFLKAMGSSPKDTREFIAEFGGGDQEIGRRYRKWKEEKDAATNQKRNMLKSFGMGGGGGATRLAPSQRF